MAWEKKCIRQQLGGEVEIEKGGLISHPQTSPPLAGPEGRVRGNNGQEILRAHHGSPGKEEDKDNYFKAITSFNSAPTPTPVLLMGINSGPDTFSGAQYMVLERGGGQRGFFPASLLIGHLRLTGCTFLKGCLGGSYYNCTKILAA